MPFARKMTDEQKREAVQAYCWGAKVADLAKRYGVSIALITDAIRKQKEAAESAR